MSTKKDMNKFEIDKYLHEFASILAKKTNRKIHCELIIVGGASILLNYNFRDTTTDIDCFERSGLLMNEVINEIANRNNLNFDWINTSFVQSPSFSHKIIQYSQYYKSYCYGTLEVRTIVDEYLIAMKLVSFRNYKYDLSDILGIVTECHKKGKELTISLIEKAVFDLYGNNVTITDDAWDYLRKVLINEISDRDEVRILEEKNRSLSKYIHKK